MFIRGVSVPRYARAPLRDDCDLVRAIAFSMKGDLRKTIRGCLPQTQHQCAESASGSARVERDRAGQARGQGRASGLAGGVVEWGLAPDAPDLLQFAPWFAGAPLEVDLDHSLDHLGTLDLLRLSLFRIQEGSRPLQGTLSGSRPCKAAAGVLNAC